MADRSEGAAGSVGRDDSGERGVAVRRAARAGPERAELGAALSELRSGLQEVLVDLERAGPDGAASERASASEGVGAERFFSIFDELRRELSSLSGSEQLGEVDAFGLDPDLLRRVRRLLDLLFDRYWRVRVTGSEHLPAVAPCLFVSNRSGLLPYDGLMLAHAIARARPEWPRARFLVADWLMTLPFAQPGLTRLGGVRACPENADRLLRAGHPVIAFPEGVKGAAKVFRDRYRLQRFGRGGAIRSALRARVPLVPVAVVGAEEAHPILFKSNSSASRALGLPFLPVTPTFPVLGPLGLLPLPTRWRIAIGEPMPLPELDGKADPGLEISRLNELLRARVQGLLDGALADRESPWS
ncbi:MAG: lysophospholipid acyltransferase family protein [bacterium]